MHKCKCNAFVVSGSIVMFLQPTNIVKPKSRMLITDQQHSTLVSCVDHCQRQFLICNIKVIVYSYIKILS